MPAEGEGSLRAQPHHHTGGSGLAASSCVLEICWAWWDQKEAASALKQQACPCLSMVYGSTDGK